MAEEVKKKTPTKPRKPRAPKAPKEALEKFEEEIKKEEPVVEEAPEVVEPEQPTVEVAPEEPKPLDIPVTEPQSFDVETLKPVDPTPEEEEPAVVAEEPKSEWLEDVDVRIQATKLPEDAPTYEEFSSSFENSPVEIKKLNSNLPDSKSKWVVRFATKTGGYHELFKGSYSRAYAVAQRRNKTLGFGGEVRKIRSK